MIIHREMFTSRIMEIDQERLGYFSTEVSVRVIDNIAVFKSLCFNRIYDQTLENRPFCHI